MNEADFSSPGIPTEWLRQREALMMLAKMITNIATLSNRRFVQVFPFSWSS